MTPALETLMLVFSPDGGGVVPAPCLFLGAEPHPLLHAWEDVTGWQPLKPKADRWNAAGFRRVDHIDGRKFPLVMVLPGKSRDETLTSFAMARDALAPGGRIAAALANSSGASRFETEFAKATGGVDSLQKHKCRAFHAVEDGTWNENLFGEWRGLGGPKRVGETGFVTAAGVFSEGRVDAGSLLLSQHLPAGLRGRAADLGAGWGYLSDALLRRCPAVTSVDLYEADARALACARSNLEPHRREITYHWHDVAAGIPGGYDIVIMNPPFHTGRDADVDLGRSFLRAAAGALRRGGKLLLVANRQLPYEAVLADLGFASRSPAENAVYKVILADKR